ncbi:FOG: TPR repeat [Hahella chejuensis KCTC 2396]|uniref:FOG: TPR repeat n=1 Tax=Hahella chejuensis (strain KCTC 2396) TaxID=349521 RepID=Q2SIX9_HAHCH|nr:tetratricopeptide repeat protein [Hahella chejuensis]ABC29395.1 FOG: TPR repeat [Hahella chejuensis KCTC 2396]
MKTFFSRISSLRVGCLALTLLLAACSGAPQKPSNNGGATGGADLSQVPEGARNQYAAALRDQKARNFGSALKKFQTVSEDYPQLSGPYINMGIIYMNTDAPDQAQAMFEKAVSVNGLNPEGYTLLGYLARRQGKFTEAEEYYRKAIAVDGSYAPARLNLGITYDLYMGKLKEALEQYQIYQSLQAQPDDEVNRWIVDLQSRLQ